jgi:hypothetical protein
VNKLLLSLTPLAALFVCNFAMATTTADLTVTGQIIPATCNISLTGGGVINYGTLSVGGLDPVDSTLITPSMSGTHPKSTMNINCDAPAQIAVNVTDNRAATVNLDVLTGGTLPGATVEQVFGMGADGVGTNIGAFTITSTSGGTLVDSAPGRVIESFDGNSWAHSTGEFNNTANWRMSWASVAGNTPEPIQAIAQELEIQAAVTATENLDTSVPINLDGSVTIELVYL